MKKKSQNLKAYLLCLLAGKIPEKLGDYHNSEWQSCLFSALSNYSGYWKWDNSRSERTASNIFCQRPLLYGKEWTALAHYTRGIVFLRAVNQIPERKHDVFQIITEDDQVLFCQRQVSEFRPQLRFPNEKAPLSPYCLSYKQYSVLKSGSLAYIGPKIHLQLPLKILIFSPFSLNSQPQKPWMFPFRKQHHSSPHPPINWKASASAIHTPIHPQQQSVPSVPGVRS